ncbi:putative zinc-ribbon domain plant [Arabidopsis suecica]|uniref:Putative zinc-ribbon domain plant n=1 Tax=Arabidopsis suecica TaxID=45249 RepID=A0A8T2A492_ARASU|nr:putative zinc-ribbon domain plant [Arabidopsis suecica]
METEWKAHSSVLEMIRRSFGLRRLLEAALKLDKVPYKRNDAAAWKQYLQKNHQSLQKKMIERRLSLENMSCTKLLALANNMVATSSSIDAPLLKPQYDVSTPQKFLCDLNLTPEEMVSTTVQRTEPEFPPIILETPGKTLSETDQEPHDRIKKSVLETGSPAGVEKRKRARDDEKFQLGTPTLKRKNIRPKLTDDNKRNNAAAWKEYLQRNQRSLHQKAAAEDPYKYAKNYVVWDVDNCNIPKGMEPSQIARNICKALRSANLLGSVTIDAAGTKITDRIQEKLQSSGIRVSRVYSAKPQATDIKLITRLGIWTKENPEAANILIVSGDGDFNDIAEHLRVRGHNVMVALILRGSNIDLKVSAARVWDWSSLAETGGGQISQEEKKSIREKYDELREEHRRSLTKPTKDVMSGNAPFIKCQICYQLLQVPSVGQKVICGSCSCWTDLTSAEPLWAPRVDSSSTLSISNTSVGKSHPPSIIFFFLNFSGWDVWGEDKRHYLHHTHGLIFVVDCIDRGSIMEAKDELHLMMKKGELRDAVLLVFANNQALPNAMNTDDITDKLELHSLHQQVWCIHDTCASSGYGLYKGLDCLSKNIAYKKDFSDAELIIDTDLLEYFFGEKILCEFGARQRDQGSRLLTTSTLYGMER